MERCCVADFWNVFYIETSRFALDTFRAATLPGRFGRSGGPGNTYVVNCLHSRAIATLLRSHLQFTARATFEDDRHLEGPSFATRKRALHRRISGDKIQDIVDPGVERALVETNQKMLGAKPPPFLDVCLWVCLLLWLHPCLALSLCGSACSRACTYACPGACV